MAIPILSTISCNESNNDVNRVGRMNDDLSFFMQLKSWAVSERRISRAWLSKSFHWCFLLLTQDSFIRVGWHGEIVIFGGDRRCNNDICRIPAFNPFAPTVGNERLLLSSGVDNCNE